MWADRVVMAPPRFDENLCFPVQAGGLVVLPEGVGLLHAFHHRAAGLVALLRDGGDGGDGCGVKRVGRSAAPVCESSVCDPMSLPLSERRATEGITP